MIRLALVMGLVAHGQQVDLSSVVVREATADRVQTICTCDSNMRPEPTQAPTANIAYITVIHGDADINGENRFVKEYLVGLVETYTDNLSVRFIRKNSKFVKAISGAQGVCEKYPNGYEVVELEQDGLQRFRDGTYDDDGWYNNLFNTIYSGSTYNCDAYANRAVMRDLNAFKSAYNGHVNAIKLTLQPFGSAKEEYAPGIVENIQSAYNNEDFLDSAVVITNAVFDAKNTWKSNLDEQNTDMLECALSESKVEDGCDGYKIDNQKESNLSKLGRNRQSCPMIPNWEERKSGENLYVFAKAMGKLMGKSLTSNLELRGPRPDPEEAVIINKLPNKNLTIPDNVICSYDVMIAIDLECIDFNENPVVVSFAKQLIRDVFRAARDCKIFLKNRK